MASSSATAARERDLRRAMTTGRSKQRRPDADAVVDHQRDEHRRARRAKSTSATSTAESGKISRGK